jgi:hypothetical protein
MWDFWTFRTFRTFRMGIPLGKGKGVESGEKVKGEVGGGENAKR